MTKVTSQVKKRFTYRNALMVVGGLIALYGLYSFVYGRKECPPSTMYTPTKVESRVVEKTTYTTNHHKPDKQVAQASANGDSTSQVSA